ncbi:unnamed protein product, partial [Oppiella nova]
PGSQLACKTCSYRLEDRHAIVKCGECDWICEECLKLHSRIKILKGHHLEDKCETHQGKVVYYCITCAKGYCSRCPLPGHLTHDIYVPKNTVPDHSRELRETAHKLQTTLNASQKTLTQLRNYETEITAQKAQCYALMKSTVLTMRQMCRQLFAELSHLIKYNSKLHNATQSSTSIEHLDQFVAAILGTHNDPVTRLLITEPAANQFIINQINKFILSANTARS